MYICGVHREVDTGDTYFRELGTSLAKQVFRTRESIKKKPILGSPLFARINHGRWVVSCPNCPNVEFAFEDGLFFCSQCQSEIRRVVLPEERKEIETILGKRMIINRHWNPGDTIQSLNIQNELYRLPAGEVS